MLPVMPISAREKNVCLGKRSFPNRVDFFLGPGNRTKYLYDNEGNRTTKTAGDGLMKTEYTFDNRNRLTSSTNFSRASLEDPWTQGATVLYSFDVFDRLISRSVAGTESADEQDAFIYDGQNLFLTFNKPASQESALSPSNLAKADLFGPAVDQCLAEIRFMGGANVSGGGSSGGGSSGGGSSGGGSSNFGIGEIGEIDWFFGDNQNTVRDVAVFTPDGNGGGTTAIVDHLTFGNFG
jgi:YD repeat-containing protein